MQIIPSPKQVNSGTDWSKAWSNDMVGAVMALKTDGTAWVWGRN